MKRTTINLVVTVAVLALLLPASLLAQCTLSVTTTVTESRCKATGSITINVSGGSGDYNYKITGAPVPIVTSTNIITGLAAGTYNIEVKDLSSGCTISASNVVVTGIYQDPRFILSGTDVTCIDGSDGSISVINQQYGLAPFVYSIVAPSASGVGTSNNTGIFTNLSPGDYYIRMSDSCGGIQTRIYTISNYNWWIDSKTVTKNGCDSADVSMILKDSKNNSNTSGTTFSGFQYGVSKGPGDTTWFGNRNFRFYLGHTRTVTLLAKDGCGHVKTTSWTDAVPSVGGSVSISSKICSGFTATITGQQNLASPQYCLYDNSDVLVTCNSTGVFSNVPYGSYCIRIQDNCYDTLITRCFTVSQPVPSVSASVTTGTLGCSTFTATVTGQTNLNSPNYCIYDDGNNLLTCNGTGVFPGLPYGTYTIRITDGCTGQVITRTFTRLAPVPTVGATVSVSSQTCSTFTGTVTGQSNLNSPQYCLYDNLNNLITCNSTGVFPGLTYGSYCVHVTNNASCYDTTIVRCFTVTQPVPAGGSVNISNKDCTGFTARVTGQSNLTNPQYCLYDDLNNQIACNSSGQFDNVPYGSYCIHITNDPGCFDTVITRCFSVTQPVPSVGASISTSNKTCSGFQATVTGKSNLTNPQFCLYDNSNTLVSCNSTGVFTNIPYGAYSIRVTNDAGCYDTVIVRNFSETAPSMNPSVSAAASCTIGTTSLTVNWSATGGPYSIRVYNPGGALVSDQSTSSSSIVVNGLVGLPAGMQYKVVVADNCGAADSAMVTPLASSVTRSINANSKCPGGLWLDGSGDLVVNAQYSQGTITPKIIKKDNAAVNISYSSMSGSNFTFSNLEPAAYVVEYSLQSCPTKLYDTFNLAAYSFPNLGQSAVYQCNNNSFSVSAAVSGGLSPYSYEVIGSLPSSPSIAAAPQASPVFSINNGTTYGLVRLRAIDACGNATINDASVLPLANTTISATSDCFYNDITLSVDTIPNASYTWYRKTSPTDSVLMTTGQSFNMPYLLPADTGTYVAFVSVNSGCLTRVSYFDVTGMCGGAILAANELSFSGRPEQEGVVLNWTTGKGYSATGFVVERSTDGRHFEAIGRVAAGARAGESQSRYLFTDHTAAQGRNYYRLKSEKADRFSYSEIVLVTLGSGSGVLAMPNPAEGYFDLQFHNVPQGTYLATLVGLDGKELLKQKFSIRDGGVKRFARPAAARAGVHYLILTNESGTERQIIKILFR